MQKDQMYFNQPIYFLNMEPKFQKKGGAHASFPS